MTRDTDVLEPHRQAIANRPHAPPNRLCFAAAHVVLHESYRALNHSLDRPGTAEQIAGHIDMSSIVAARLEVVEVTNSERMVSFLRPYTYPLWDLPKL